MILSFLVFNQIRHGHVGGPALEQHQLLHHGEHDSRHENGRQQRAGRARRHENGERLLRQRQRPHVRHTQLCWNDFSLYENNLPFCLPLQQNSLVVWKIPSSCLPLQQHEDNASVAFFILGATSSFTFSAFFPKPASPSLNIRLIPQPLLPFLIMTPRHPFRLE